MKAIILAAGYATRLYPLTLDKPKALLPIADKPIIDYIIEKMPSEVDRVFIVTNDKFYMNFVWWLEKQKESEEKKIEIINDGTISNDTKLGGIGDLWFVINEKKIDDNILVILGDNFFSFSLDGFINFFKSVRKTMTGVIDVDKEKAKRFGVVEMDGEKVISFEEKPEEPRTNLVSIGIYIFSREDLEMIKEYMKTDLNKDGPGYLIKHLSEKGEVYAYKFRGEWYDIGSIEEYENLK